MMDLMNLPITIVVKAPNQKIADQTVECALNWTVRKLKEHLSNVYPSKPMENQQRIIYSGKLLQDDVTLKEVLRQYEPNQTTHTVHLVCSASATDSYKSNPQPAVSTTPDINQSSSLFTASDVLRHRHFQTPTDGEQQTSNNMYMPFNHHPLQATYPHYNVNALHSAQYGSYTQSPFATQFVPAMPGSMAAAGPMFPYSSEQMAWMQQAYSHYLAQWMQHLQQPQPTLQPVVLPTAVTQPHIQPANQNLVNNMAADPVGRQEPAQIRMNAQGGPVMDDDDGEAGNGDWLDYVYTFIRFIMLVLILNLNSSPQRFVLVTLAVIIVFCLFHGGWFPGNRGQVPAHQEQPANPDAQANDQMPEGEVASDNTNPEPAEQQPPAGLDLAWSFVVGFFSSIVPQPPVDVNAN